MGKITVFLLICLFSLKMASQNKDSKAEAAFYFDTKDFKKAYELYEKLYNQFPKMLEYKFRLGYSALYYPEKKLKAVEIFEDIKKIDKATDIDYYLAKAYHINYKFDEALNSYQNFINAKRIKISSEDEAFIADSKVGIMNCKNGKELLSKKANAEIKNIGIPINTDEIEGVPVISADESILIFTYVGKKSKGGLLNDMLKVDNTDGFYHEDIFMSNRVNDSTWGAPQDIESLNTNGNDAAIAISPDGQLLFSFVSDSKNPGDLYVSSLSGNDWSSPVKLNSNINSDEWEGSCSITADGKYLYFASERPGGFGGKDLYVSEKENGDWGIAKNLGPIINTKYNEDAPFIHPDGITLFFSSEGHKSIGGYDIMYSIRNENTWIEPMSMGIPLNTTEDDRYYVINANGNLGYFSSNRGGNGGKGKQDIYTVTPGILGDKPILALLKGSVFVDDKPAEAKIELIKKLTNETSGPYFSNSITGKFLIALSPGSSYKLKISINGLEPTEEEIDVEKLEKFVEIKKEFYVYSPGFESKKTQDTQNTITDSLVNNITKNEVVKKDAVNPCGNYPIPDFTAIKGKSLSDADVYKQLLKIGGSICAEGLVFKVQIAAYKHAENYKYDHLQQFGSPEIVIYPDGITRFTQLKFATINEAEIARQKIISKGQKDAWITAFIDGKRFTLEELITVNFNSKAIN